MTHTNIKWTLSGYCFIKSHNRLKSAQKQKDKKTEKTSFMFEWMGRVKQKKQTVFNEQKLFFCLWKYLVQRFILCLLFLYKYCNWFFRHFKNDKYSYQSFLSGFTEYKSIIFGINWEFVLNLRGNWLLGC